MDPIGFKTETSLTFQFDSTQIICCDNPTPPNNSNTADHDGLMVVNMSENPRPVPSTRNSRLDGVAL